MAYDLIAKLPAEHPAELLEAGRAAVHDARGVLPVYVFTYIYIYREREIHIYIYIYTYSYT